MPKIWYANKQNPSLLVYADATQLQILWLEHLQEVLMFQNTDPNCAIT